MTAKELKELFIRFFTERGHMEISSASLLPDNDPCVLFTTAGMHPLVPYLLGQPHPCGKRLVNVQKCVRTCDIDEVGDPNHMTYFEMLGNWSLGDYFKKEAIGMSYEFLTEHMDIPAYKLAVTVFMGDETAPRDNEAYEIWQSLGLKDSQIYFYGKDDNWWGPAGLTGPCGPDTEIFYDNGNPKCSETCGPSCHCGKYVEIWNNVFMEYNKNEDGSYSILKQKTVDTGMAVERILPFKNHVDTVYKTELFLPLTDELQSKTGIMMTEANQKQFRIICEHTRSSIFILSDPAKIVPSNTEQGYILRRLIRRAIRYSKQLFSSNLIPHLANFVIKQYGEDFPELIENESYIMSKLNKESDLFEKTLDQGLRKAENYLNKNAPDMLFNGELAFKLYDTYGFPLELTCELAQEKGIRVDTDGFYTKYEEHQKLSRSGAEGRFKGGLSDNSEKTTRLHTATHLLNGALRQVLGDTVFQKGSNINSERLRFDFSFHRKLTDKELKEVSDIVNNAIHKNITIKCEELTAQEAKSKGAIGVFTDKYGDIVKVYSIGNYSCEICGGPHAKSTGELGSFKIIKVESVSTGVRRIKAVISE